MILGVSWAAEQHLADRFFFFKQKTAYDIGLGIPAEPLFRSQRLMNAMRQAHADGWFIVFDTLTLADDRLEAFYDNPNALRDYFRDIGRMVLAAEGRRLMIHTPTAISIFVCLSMVQLMAVFISMRCTLCGHFLQVALTLILVVGYAIAAS